MRRTFHRTAEEAERRRTGALVTSVVSHVLLAVFAPLGPRLPPPEPPIELALVAMGEPDRPVAPAPAEPESAPAPSPTPLPPSEPVAPPSPALAPDGDRFWALQQKTRPRLQPPQRSSRPEAPRTFEEHQRQRFARLDAAAAEVAAGAEIGRDAISREGRKRCDAITSRHADIVYLLFDSSGSMNSIMKSQAITCAHQYASTAIDSGSTVVVGAFALDARISQPTRSLTDVEIALRSPTNISGTVLPTRELGPFFDRYADKVADLVIISDGWFLGQASTRSWYRYFLELNPDNRGTLFTVGGRGHVDGVAELRDLGFDVHRYDPIQGR